MDQNKIQWQFIGFLGAILLAFLYENGGLDGNKEVGYNQFLNELKKGSVESVKVVDKEYALFKTRSGVDLQR